MLHNIIVPRQSLVSSPSLETSGHDNISSRRTGRAGWGRGLAPLWLEIRWGRWDAGSVQFVVLSLNTNAVGDRRGAARAKQVGRLLAVRRRNGHAGTLSIPYKNSGAKSAPVGHVILCGSGCTVTCLKKPGCSATTGSSPTPEFQPVLLGQ